jgi:hypothetical protein
LRPLSGTLLTSGSETVEAIWLRALSRTVASAATSTLASTPLRGSVNVISNADPTLNASLRVAISKPCSRAVIS